MAWTPSRDMMGRVLGAYLNGETPPDPSKFYLILTNASTFGDNSTIADVVQQELVQQFGYSRQQYNPPIGAYDAAQYRYEIPGVTMLFTASGGAMQFDGVALISNANPTANKVFTPNAATNRLTVATHGLSNGDRVVPSADSAAALPGGMISTAYYSKIIDADIIELYTEASLTNIVDFSDNGSGTLRLRYAQGNFELYEILGTSTIPDGASQNIIVYINLAGAGVDVNAA